mgnify:CR=1 FL=1
MKNALSEGENITVTTPVDVASGEPVLIGALFGVAIGAAVVLRRRGGFELAKVSAQAWTQGQAIYWDDTAKLCTTVATDNTLIGAALLAAANPSSTGNVLLDGTIR